MFAGKGLAVNTQTFSVSSNFDTGWLLISGTISAGGTVTAVKVVSITSSILTVTMYVDSVYVGAAAPVPTTGFELIQSAGGIPGAVKVNT